MQAILEVATLGTSQRAEGEDPAMIEGGQEKEKKVWVTAGQVLVEIAYHRLGCSPKRRPQTECSSAMVGV